MSATNKSPSNSSVFQNFTNHADAREASSSTSEPALTKRGVDDSHCLSGLLEIVEMRSTRPIHGFIGFAALACYILCPCSRVVLC